MIPTITTIFRLSTAAVAVWIHQFGIVVWFMVGQGFDRSTATLVIWASLVLLPLTAWLIRAGMADLEGSRMMRTGKAIAYAAGLLAAGVLIPGWLILNAASFGSPFAELWWLLGASSLIQGGILFYLKAPARRRVIFGLVFLSACALGLPLWRALIFSIFG